MEAGAKSAYDPEAEAVALELDLISQLLHEQSRCDLIKGILSPEHFLDQTLGWVYGTIIEWHDAGRTLTMPMLVQRYKDVVHDTDLVARVLEWVNHPISYSRNDGLEIAESIQRMGTIRNLQKALSAVATRPFEDPRDLSAEVERLVSAHAVGADEAEYSRTAGDSAAVVIEQALARREGKVSDVGCYFLPEVQTFAPADLVILAARPGMGKSALAGNIARGAAESGIGTVLFSLEMSHEQCTRRIMSEMTRDGRIQCPHDVIIGKPGTTPLTDAQLHELSLCQQSLARWPLYIHDRGGMTLGQIRHWARAYKAALEARGYPLRLLVVDYLQLVRNEKSRGDIYSDTTLVSKGLKGLAKELRVPILALSQLSRGCEQRIDKRPMLSDLRDSGAIEQDADVVLFLYRDEYYLATTKPKIGQEVEHEQRLTSARGKAELIRAKDRHGRTGTSELLWDGAYQAFRSPGARL